VLVVKASFTRCRAKYLVSYCPMPCTGPNNSAAARALLYGGSVSAAPGRINGQRAGIIGAHGFYRALNLRLPPLQGFWW
jgi:hypothetical protein